MTHPIFREHAVNVAFGVEWRKDETHVMPEGCARRDLLLSLSVLLVILMYQ